MLGGTLGAIMQDLRSRREHPAKTLLLIDAASLRKHLYGSREHTEGLRIVLARRRARGARLLVVHGEQSPVSVAA